MSIEKIKKLASIPCECTQCTNWLGGKKGCRLAIKKKDGRCRHFGSHITAGYVLTREEKLASREHNRAVEAVRTAPTEMKVVKLATLQEACEANYITLEFLSRCAKKCRPGNGRYEIQCVGTNPLTIKIKGMKGSRKSYKVEE